MPRLCTIDSLRSGYVIQNWTQKKTGAQLFQRPISTNPGLDFNLRFFFLLIKSILSDNFPFFFKYQITKLQTKGIQMNLFLKLSYLNSYFVLTLGYLNPALNNPAWKDKCCMLICFTTLVFSLQLITFHDPRPTQSSCNPVGVCSFFKEGGGGFVGWDLTGSSCI